MVDLTEAPAVSAETPAPRRGRAVLLRSAAAVAGGALLYASFPPRTLWWLAPVGFALLGWALYGRRLRAGFGYGFLFGLAFLLPLLVWTGSFVGNAPWLILATFEALFIAAAGAGMAAVSRLPAAPVLAAAVWIGGEAARGRVPFGGFSWGKVAFGQPDGLLLPVAALGGSPLLSFATVLAGLGLAELVRRAVARQRRVTLVVPALAAVLPLAAGLAVSPLVATGDAAETAQAGTITAALIQGNVPQAGLEFNSQRRAVLDNHVARTEELAAEVEAGDQPQPDLVLWPENSSDIDPFRNQDAGDVIDRAAAAIDAPILVGAILRLPDETVHNAVLRWEPGVGSTAQYVKRHVQPFGEYIPMRSIAKRFSGDVERVRRPVVPGDEVGVLDVAGTTVAIATCYEVAFDYVVTDAVRAGGTVLLVPTNNATFGETEMTYQQLAMSRVRAVEHSRPVLIAATSGVSAVIAPDGTVTRQTDLFTQDALVTTVGLRTGTTLATRLGATPEWLLVAAGVAAMAVAGWRRMSARRMSGPPPEATGT